MMMLLTASLSILIPLACAFLIVISPRKADKALCIAGAALASLAALATAALFAQGSMEPQTVT